MMLQKCFWKQGDTIFYDRVIIGLIMWLLSEL